MSTRPPPVPLANRSPKGSGSQPDVPTDTAPKDRAVPENIEQQGHQANPTEHNPSRLPAGSVRAMPEMHPNTHAGLS
jgi:hypothetical protein